MSTLLSFPASVIPQAHTLIALTAFSSALLIGWTSGLWVSLCENGVARMSVAQTVLMAEWPVEWFPSVSATLVVILDLVDVQNRRSFGSSSAFSDPYRAVCYSALPAHSRTMARSPLPTSSRLITS